MLVKVSWKSRTSHVKISIRNIFVGKVAHAGDYENNDKFYFLSCARVSQVQLFYNMISLVNDWRPIKNQINPFRSSFYDSITKPEDPLSLFQRRRRRRRRRRRKRKRRRRINWHENVRMERYGGEEKKKRKVVVRKPSPLTGNFRQYDRRKGAK